jgi:hypothetical protein
VRRTHTHCGRFAHTASRGCAGATPAPPTLALDAATRGTTFTVNSLGPPHQSVRLDCYPVGYSKHSFVSSRRLWLTRSPLECGDGGGQVAGCTPAAAARPPVGCQPPTGSSQVLASQFARLAHAHSGQRRSSRQKADLLPRTRSSDALVKPAGEQPPSCRRSSRPASSLRRGSARPLLPPSLIDVVRPAQARRSDWRARRSGFKLAAIVWRRRQPAAVRTFSLRLFLIDARSSCVANAKAILTVLAGRSRVCVPYFAMANVESFALNYDRCLGQLAHHKEVSATAGSLWWWPAQRRRVFFIASPV